MGRQLGNSTTRGKRTQTHTHTQRDEMSATWPGGGVSFNDYARDSKRFSPWCSFNSFWARLSPFFFRHVRDSRWEELEREGWNPVVYIT